MTIPVDGIGLAAVLHLPQRPQAPGARRWPTVIAAHGLLSGKASEKYLRLAAAAAPHGIALCRFDFRGCGESGGALADSTLGDRLRDLQAVIAWVRRRPESDGRVALMGSSMGGFLSLWAGAADPGIAAIATWAAPAALHEMLERPAEILAAGLGEPFLAELRAGRMLEAPEGVARVLVVHGDADAVVPVDHARRLWKRAADPKRLDVLAGADHSISDPAHRDRAVALTIDWARDAFGMAGER